MGEIAFVDKTNQAIELCQKAINLPILTVVDYQTAGTLINSIRTLEKELESEYKEHPAVVEARKIQSAKGEIAKSLESARKQAKSNMIRWDEEQELQRKELERHAQAVMLKQAEDQAIRDAEANPEQADAILSAPIEVPVVVMPKTTPSVKGHSVRLAWDYMVQGKDGKWYERNEAGSVPFSDDIPREYLCLDMVKIGRVIRAMCQDASIPGIKPVQRKV